ncbi:MAG: entericidin EcnA/B family protein [Azospirillum brasilense]|nr:MAG: entericidin EcnA/B family protein [Azospirillum brasilense]
MTSRKMLTLAALSALLLASACETIEGFGRDMEKGGENIEESAQEAK